MATPAVSAISIDGLEDSSEASVHAASLEGGWDSDAVAMAVAAYPDKVPVEFWDRFEFLLDDGRMRVIINVDEDADVSDHLTGPVSWMDEDAIALITPETFLDLITDPAVRFIEPDHPVVFNLAVSVPDINGRGADAPWDLSYNGFPGTLEPGAWSEAYTGKDVTVAVVDSGIDGTHRDFGGFDCTDWLPYQPCDSRITGHIKISGQLVDLGVYPEMTVPAEYTNEAASGHGTHVAGTIAGNGYRARESADPGRYGNDGIPMGVAPEANLFDISNGDTLWAGLGGGALWWLSRHHEEYGIQVASNSWGCLGGCEYNANSATSQYIKTLFNEGVVVVFAAGNDGRGAGSGDALSSNAENPYAIGVANYNAANHQIASSSSRGKSGAALPDPATWTPESEGTDPYDRPDVAAPGTGIWSARTLTGGAASLVPRVDAGDTLGGGANGFIPYATMSGTSMAAPHVSGAAAVLFDACPDASSLDVFRAIFAGADPDRLTNTGGSAFTAANNAQTQGYGALDVTASLEWIFANTSCGGGDPVDTDGDGIIDTSDNCPTVSNADQADTDGDGIGDACDSDNNDGPDGDTDGDGVRNADDVCEGYDDNLDSDGDGIPDGCDDDDGGTSGDPAEYFFVGGQGAATVTDPFSLSTNYPMSTDGYGDGGQSWHTTVGSWNMDADENAFVPTFITSDTITFSDSGSAQAVTYIDYAFPNGFGVECSLQAQLLDGAGNVIADGPRAATTAPGTGYGLLGYEEVVFDFAVVPGTYDGIKLQYGTSGIDCGNFPMDTTWGTADYAGRLLVDPGVQPDADGDGVPDSSDNCPDTANPDQTDADGDGIGDACDSDNNDGPDGDTDGDGVRNADDVCEGYDDNLDSDGDGIPDGCDVPSTVSIDSPADGAIIDESGTLDVTGTYTAGTDDDDDDDGCQTDCEPDFGEPTSDHLRPGDLSSVCTINYLFEHQGRYFFGTAAHCVGTGGSTSTNGCTTPSIPIGSKETLRTGTGTSVTATLAYSSWDTMQRVGETDSSTCSGNDFGLFEIDSKDFDKIHPAVRMYGGPTGLGSIEDMAFGDELRAYGRSSLHDDTFIMDPESSLTNPKNGAYLGCSNDCWSYFVYLAVPGIPGDSGGGLMDVNGNALGAASTIGLFPYPASNNYANIERALEYMEAKEGWAPELVTWDTFDANPRVSLVTGGDGSSSQAVDPLAQAIQDGVVDAPTDNVFETARSWVVGLLGGSADVATDDPGNDGLVPGVYGEGLDIQMGNTDNELVVELDIGGALNAAVDGMPVTWYVEWQDDHNVAQQYRVTYANNVENIALGVVGAASSNFDLFVITHPDGNGVSTLCEVDADFSGSMLRTSSSDPPRNDGATWTIEWRIPLAEFDHDSRGTRGDDGCGGFTRNGRGLEDGDVLTEVTGGTLVQAPLVSISGLGDTVDGDDHTVSTGDQEIVCETAGTIVATFAGQESCVDHDVSADADFAFQFSYSDLGYGEHPVTVTAYADDGSVEAIQTVTVIVPLPDADGDGVGDDVDNCVDTPNADQADMDGDGIGDACDEDRDGDGVANDDDAFPDDGTEWSDMDGDGIGDNSDDDLDGDGHPNNADNCPEDANADQANMDGDHRGDVCDADTDGDGHSNGKENAHGSDPYDPNSTP